jgi:hypothetical protein
MKNELKSLKECYNMFGLEENAILSLQENTILSLQGNAALEEIKKAARQLKIQWHPDRFLPEQQEEADTKSKEIGNAYDIIEKSLYEIGKLQAEIKIRKNIARVLKLRPTKGITEENIEKAIQGIKQQALGLSSESIDNLEPYGVLDKFFEFIKEKNGEVPISVLLYIDKLLLEIKKLENELEILKIQDQKVIETKLANELFKSVLSRIEEDLSELKDLGKKEEIKPWVEKVIELVNKDIIQYAEDKKGEIESKLSIDFFCDEESISPFRPLVTTWSDHLGAFEKNINVKEFLQKNKKTIAKLGIHISKLIGRDTPSFFDKRDEEGVIPEKDKLFERYLKDVLIALIKEHSATKVGKNYLEAREQVAIAFSRLGDFVLKFYEGNVEEIKTKLDPLVLMIFDETRLPVFDKRTMSSSVKRRIKNLDPNIEAGVKVFECFFKADLNYNVSIVERIIKVSPSLTPEQENIEEAILYLQQYAKKTKEQSKSDEILKFIKKTQRIIDQFLISKKEEKIDQKVSEAIPQKVIDYLSLCMNSFFKRKSLDFKIQNDSLKDVLVSIFTEDKEYSELFEIMAELNELHYRLSPRLFYLESNKKNIQDYIKNKSIPELKKIILNFCTGNAQRIKISAYKIIVNLTYEMGVQAVKDNHFFEKIMLDIAGDILYLEYKKEDEKIIKEYRKCLDVIAGRSFGEFSEEKVKNEIVKEKNFELEDFETIEAEVIKTKKNLIKEKYTETKELIKRAIKENDKNSIGILLCNIDITKLMGEKNKKNENFEKEFLAVIRNFEAEFSTRKKFLDSLDAEGLKVFWEGESRYKLELSRGKSYAITEELSKSNEPITKEKISEELNKSGLTVPNVERAIIAIMQGKGGIPNTLGDVLGNEFLGVYAGGHQVISFGDTCIHLRQGEKGKAKFKCISHISSRSMSNPGNSKVGVVVFDFTVGETIEFGRAKYYIKLPGIVGDFEKFKKNVTEAEGIEIFSFSAQDINELITSLKAERKESWKNICLTLQPYTETYRIKSAKTEEIEVICEILRIVKEVNEKINFLGGSVDEIKKKYYRMYIDELDSLLARNPLKISKGEEKKAEQLKWEIDELVSIYSIKNIDEHVKLQEKREKLSKKIQGNRRFFEKYNKALFNFEKDKKEKGFVKKEVQRLEGTLQEPSMSSGDALVSDAQKEDELSSLENSGNFYGSLVAYKSLEELVPLTTDIEKGKKELCDYEYSYERQEIDKAVNRTFVEEKRINFLIFKAKEEIENIEKKKENPIIDKIKKEYYKKYIEKLTNFLPGPTYSSEDWTELKFRAEILNDAEKLSKEYTSEKIILLSKHMAERRKYASVIDSLLNDFRTQMELGNITYKPAKKIEKIENILFDEVLSSEAYATEEQINSNKKILPIPSTLKDLFKNTSLELKELVEIKSSMSDLESDFSSKQKELEDQYKNGQSIYKILEQLSVTLNSPVKNFFTPLIEITPFTPNREHYIDLSSIEKVTEPFFSPDSMPPETPQKINVSNVKRKLSFEEKKDALTKDEHIIHNMLVTPDEKKPRSIWKWVVGALLIAAPIVLPVVAFVSTVVLTGGLFEIPIFIALTIFVVSAVISTVIGGGWFLYERAQNKKGSYDKLSDSSDDESKSEPEPKLTFEDLNIPKVPIGPEPHLTETPTQPLPKKEEGLNLDQKAEAAIKKIKVENIFFIDLALGHEPDQVLLNHVISEGEYKGQTLAYHLSKTKEGCEYLRDRAKTAKVYDDIFKQKIKEGEDEFSISSNAELHGVNLSEHLALRFTARVTTSVLLDGLFDSKKATSIQKFCTQNKITCDYDIKSPIKTFVFSFGDEKEKQVIVTLEKPSGDINSSNIKISIYISPNVVPERDKQVVSHIFNQISKGICELRQNKEIKATYQKENSLKDKNTTIYSAIYSEQFKAEFNRNAKKLNDIFEAPCDTTALHKAINVELSKLEQSKKDKVKLINYEKIPQRIAPVDGTSLHKDGIVLKEIQTLEKGQLLIVPLFRGTGYVFHIEKRNNVPNKSDIDGFTEKELPVLWKYNDRLFMIGLQYDINEDLPEKVLTEIKEGEVSKELGESYNKIANSTNKEEQIFSEADGAVTGRDAISIIKDIINNNRHTHKRTKNDAKIDEIVFFEKTGKNTINTYLLKVKKGTPSELYTNWVKENFKKSENEYSVEALSELKEGDEGYEETEDKILIEETKFFIENKRLISKKDLQKIKVQEEKSYKKLEDKKKPQEINRNPIEKENFLQTPQVEKLFNLSEKKEIEIATENSLKTAQKERINIGPRKLDGFEIEDVAGEGDCGYLALIKQFKLIKSPRLEKMPLDEARKVEFLRRQMQEEYKPLEYMEEKNIKQFLMQHREMIVGILDTRNPQFGYSYLFYDHTNENTEGWKAFTKEEVEALNTRKDETQQVIRLAYNGNHYMSINSDPYNKEEHVIDILQFSSIFKSKEDQSRLITDPRLNDQNNGPSKNSN